MKNKLFWPIVLVAVVIIVESIMLLSGRRSTTTNTNTGEVTKVTPTENVTKAADAVSFEWQKEKDGKPTLIMKANRAVAIDAIDLYIGYRNVKIISVKDLGELTKPSFSKISAEKSLVVVNYLIPEANGFKMVAGQSVKVVELEVGLLSTTKFPEFSIDPKTQVVENSTAKVLPFNSKNLIIELTL